MNVTGCVPLAGQGLVARRGNLTALSDGLDPGPDPLLTALSAVADASGDGAALALAGTRAALERGGRPAWACAGVTFGGEVAVLVHGEAIAHVCADGGPEAEITASGSMIPVVRSFTGAVVTVRLAVGAPAAPDPRLWLDGGIVYGGGLLLTVTQEASQAFVPNESQPSAAVTASADGEQVGEDTVSRHPEPASAGPVSPSAVSASAVSASAVSASNAVSASPVPAVPDPAATDPVPVEASYQPGYEPTMLAGPAARDVPPPPGAALPQTLYPEALYPETLGPEVASPEADTPSAQADGVSPAFEPGYEPTMLAGSAQRPADAPAGFGDPAHGQVASCIEAPQFLQAPQFTEAPQFLEAPQFTEAQQSPGAQQFPDDPFAAGPALNGAASHSAAPHSAASHGAVPNSAASSNAGLVIGTGSDTESWFRSEAEPVGPTARMTQSDFSGLSGMSEPPIADLSTMEMVALAAVEPVMIDGTACARMHFNPPEAMFCRECGMSMHDVPRNLRRQPRPPLGVLLVDDGRGFTLDRDYVIGREPVLDGDVAAGRATPLRIIDPKGTVSRLHLGVSLVGWQVEVRDLGSANGSVLYRQGGPRPLAPLDVAVLDPGARVGVGRRTVQFLPFSASPLGGTPYGAT
jgi:hypothetical protein